MQDGEMTILVGCRPLRRSGQTSGGGWKFPPSKTVVFDTCKSNTLLAIPFEVPFAGTYPSRRRFRRSTASRSRFAFAVALMPRGVRTFFSRPTHHTKPTAASRRLFCDQRWYSAEKACSPNHHHASRAMVSHDSIINSADHKRIGSASVVS